MNVGVTQRLLDYFGVNFPRAQKGSAGVPKIVEVDGVGEPRLLEQRLKGAVEDIVATQGRADGRGEDKPVILPQLG